MGSRDRPRKPQAALLVIAAVDGDLGLCSCSCSPCCVEAAIGLPARQILRPELELFLERYPDEESQAGTWKLPKVKGGGIKVPLDQLHDLATDDQTRGAKRR